MTPHTNTGEQQPDAAGMVLPHVGGTNPHGREKGTTWTRAITRALSAVRLLTTAMGYRGFVPPSLSISAATYGHVASIETQARPVKPQPSDWEARLHARAIRRCNRNQRAVAQYMQTHLALKAACSEARRNG